MTKVVLAILSVVFLAVFFTMRQGEQYKEFMKTAEKTSAVLLKKEVRDNGQKNRRKEYWVVYSYNTRGNHSYTTREWLEYEDIWMELTEGQRVEVYFNKDKPNESHLAQAIERRIGLAEKLTK